MIGGGNAGLSAALAARQAGARVLLLEKTSPEWRGGNSKYTRNLRVASPEYPEAEFLDDLVRVSGPDLDRELATAVIGRSPEHVGWMSSQGVRWQPALRGTLQLSRTNRFFLGGGKALLNVYYRRAAQLGVEVRYRSEVTDLRLRCGSFQSVVVEAAAGREEIEAKAVVVASGGFEANLEHLRRWWGDAVDGFLVRGSAANDGRLLARLLDLGARPRGNPRGFHAVACDARSPRAEGGIVTRVDAIPLGIVVDRSGRRFADEGADLWPRRYASWGRLIAERPGQLAYCIFDRQALGRFIPPLYPPERAGTIAELAERLGLPAAELCRTVDAFNAAVCRSVPFDPTRLDGRGTLGLEPPKSNWALALEQPPLCAYPIRPGITFTYLGVAVDGRARVLDLAGRPMPGLYAAGEAMAGNLLSDGYLGGFGMTVGGVMGRVAGEEAARYALA